MRHRVRTAVVHSTALALACAASYLLTTRVLIHVHQISPHDAIIGGMWSVIATVFVFRLRYEQSLAAAFSRASATVMSFAICFVYLLFLPFSIWGLALLIGTGALVLLLANRADDVITATATTSVVMVLAAITPHDAWEQPILRLADTAIGIAIGLAVSWIGLRLAKVGPTLDAEGGGSVTGEASN